MSDKETHNAYLLNYKIWLSSPEAKGIMGDGKWKILKAIHEQGSLKAATESLGLTYRRTWGDLKEIENQLGFALLEKSRGGKDGGQTRVSARGLKLIEAFDNLHQELDVVMEDAFKRFRAKLEEPVD